MNVGDVLPEVPDDSVDVPTWTVPKNTDIHEARWLDAWFSAQLANVVALHVYGKPLMDLRPVLRADIKDFCDSFVEDVCKRYAGILDAVERMHR